MAHSELQTTQEIYEHLRSRLSGRIAKLTNFTDRSFNYVWTQAFSQEVRELQEVTLISELAGFIDYTGGPITEDDIEELGLEGQITAERANELMQDEYLDEYVKIVGVTRNEGERATGTVTFSTQSSETTIEEGTQVSVTQGTDDDIAFVTTEEVSTSAGETSVSDVPIEAVDVGARFNVPAGAITRISNPPIGVTGVNNPTSTTGGEDRESNDELRERAKSAVGGASEGGTTEGIKSYIRNNVDGVQQGDVIIDEFTGEQPPFVDVIVDGGLDSNVTDAIEFSRPAGISHTLVRPQVIQLGANVNLLGSDITHSDVADSITDFLLELGISENFYSDQLIRTIMQSDDNIINIDSLDSNIERVTNETFEYSTDIDAAIADDGGSLTNETIAANNSNPDDLTLLPSSPSVGDAYYFGEDTVFSELDLIISTPGDGTWDIVWEYYDGSTWSQFGTITDGTSNFQTAGTGTVMWDIPSDWTSTTIGDVNSAYFVRARLDSFTSISTQPLGEEVNVTGGGYRLDYTFESENGSVSVVDKSGDTYTNNTDYEMIDNSGDGWPELLVWSGGATPDKSEDFFVDYDVTVIGETKNDDKYDSELVRDESFFFNESQEDTRTFNNTSTVYEIEHVPFESTVSIVDENSTTFTEGTDYQLTAPQEYATEDTFTYETGTTEYSLSSDIEIDFVAIHDENDNIYVRGTDYTTTDSDADGFDDTISWDTNNSVPADQTAFTVVYDAYPRGIRWDTNNSTPPQDDTFTVSYTQALYETRMEIVETPGGIIRDVSGDLYNEDTEYVLVDSTRDGENDGVYWTTNPATIGDGEEFFVSYITEGDVRFGDREKIDPGTITVMSEV